MAADSPVPGPSPGLPGEAGDEASAKNAQDDDVNIKARSILKISRDAEFLHSFLRVDHGDSDSEGGDAPPSRIPGTGPGPSAQKADDRGDGDGGGGDGGRPVPRHHDREEPSTRRHHKATFKEVVKELEHSYGGLGALAGSRKGAKGRRGRVVRGEEVYTDKDRAAAVQMGHRDIKQSLRMKRHQERVHALQLPEEADGSTLLALGQYELRQGNIDIAIAFVNKALQLCPEDKTALVARSKCYLLLGQPRLALQDAETALEPDRNFVRAIFQKAEALYHLGDFEHSLMYYHRGLRLRPELAVFRLGVQKAQEAIENTIGTGIEESCKIMEEMERSKSGRAGSTRSHSSRSSRSSKTNRLANNGPSSGSTEGEEQSARRLLGELCVDKLYLEQLLKHPDIRCARKDRNRTSQIAEHAEDGVEFLRNRQEFWRQQKLSTGPGGVAVSGGGGSARRMQPSPGGHGSGSARSSARLTTASPQAVT